jgi:hypothetical protein
MCRATPDTLYSPNGISMGSQQWVEDNVLAGKREHSCISRQAAVGMSNIRNSHCDGIAISDNQKSTTIR